MRQQLIDHESELRVLSSIMHDERACITAFANLKDEDFHDPFRRAVFQLLEHIYITGNKPTVAVTLREGFRLGFIEGKSQHDKLQEIYNHDHDPENIEYWIDNLKKVTKRRKTRELIVNSYRQLENVEDIDLFIADIGNKFFDLAIERNQEEVYTGDDLAEFGIGLVKERVKKYRKNIELLKITGEYPLEGLPTGFPDLNRLFLGYKPGDLILVGAQTGHGKTAFALNTTKTICVDNKERVLYINTEMSKEQVAFRWGGMLSGIPVHNLRTGQLSETDLEKIEKSFRRLQKSGLTMLNERRLNVQKMNMLTRKYVMQKQIKLVVLDYVGRMEKRDPKLQEWQALEDIAKEMKILAQDLNIACMVLFQLNADDTIQGSSRMKNECDLMLKLHQMPSSEKEAENFKKELEKYRKKQYEDFNYYIHVDKSRDSASGVIVPVVFGREVQQIRQANEIKQPKDEWSDIGTEINEKDLEKRRKR